MKFEARKGLVERSYKAWGTGDLGALFAIYHPQCEWDNARLGLPDIPKVSRGHAEMAEFRRISLGMFPELFPVAREIIDLSDEEVLVIGAWEARTAGARSPILDSMSSFGQRIEFRAGLIFRVEFFSTPDEARAAAGLP